MKISRGEIWAVDFEPQTHKEEPGKRARPALVLQSNLLNHNGYTTTIVVPGTSDTYQDAQGDGYPLRVRVGKQGALKDDTDLLIDQIRTISNRRLIGTKPLTTLSANHLTRVTDALALLTT